MLARPTSARERDAYTASFIVFICLLFFINKSFSTGGQASLRLSRRSLSINEIVKVWSMGSFRGNCHENAQMFDCRGNPLDQNVCQPRNNRRGRLVEA